MPKSILSMIVPAAMAIAAASPALAAPNVVASLKPIHSLVAGVMEGVGEPGLIVQGAASEHGYSLRPSDAARIEGADLIFWVGPDMETYMTGMLDTLGADAQVTTLMEVEGLTLLELREGGLFEPHEHDHGGGHGEDDDDHSDHDHDHDDHASRDNAAHDHDHADAHIWLDPENARLMVAAIADALIVADPDNAQIYNANGQALAERLTQLQDAIEERIGDARGKPFFVFHDAYHGFEHRFDIEAAGSFTVNPEVAPGAARLTEIRGIVESTQGVCLFAEPQFSPQVVETIAQGTNTRIGTLDPLGADIEDGPDLYFTLLDRMADSLIECLAD